MAAPTVYRWDDDNAPVLAINDSDNSALVEIVKACLVDGYGSKMPPGAGYSLEFENADGTAIAIKSQSPDSNGFYYSVATDRAIYEDPLKDPHINRINMYESMTDAISGMNSTYSGRLLVCHNDYSGYFNEPIAWVLVADDRAFYIFLYTERDWQLSDNPDFDYITAYSNGFFGDFNPISPDPWSSLVWSYVVDADSDGRFGTLRSYNYAITGAQVKRSRGGLDPDGHVVSIYHGGGPFLPDDGMGYSESSDETTPFGEGEPTFITRPMLSDTTNPKNFRGYIPGLYYPCHNRPYKNLEQVTVAGKTFLAVRIRFNASNDGQVLIDLGDWRA